MINRDIWKLFMDEDDESLSVTELMHRTSYDDLLEIDLRRDRFRMLEHTEDKYSGVNSEGEFSRLYYFAVEHFVHPDDREAYRELINPYNLESRMRQSAVPGVLSGHFRMKGTDGEWIRTRQILLSGPDADLPEGIVHCYVYDVQKQHDRVEGDDPRRSDEASALRREEITGLPEGIEFFRFVQRRLETLRDGWCVVAVVIDHFKLFTEWYGLESSRYLLSRLGETLRDTARALNGYAGYLGQEQFCLVLPFDRPRIDALYARLQSLVGSVSRMDGFWPIFGIAGIDDSSSQIMDFYNHAALALEEIAGDAHVHIKVYDAEIHRKNAEEYRILYEFQNALESGRILFWLQPQCRVNDHRIVGAESLARWRRPDGSWLSPAVFVPVLERYGLVTQLDQYIWEAVIRWQKGRVERSLPVVPVSVNVSRLDILSMDVPGFFGMLLEKYQLSPESLKVEITESAYVDDSDAVGSAVEQLRKLGLSVLMDDFGSGYSSLNMLGKVDMDVIKLDAHFLRMEETKAHKSVSILESIINMTRNLSTPIIVEGVETEEQVRFLEDLGCSYMQGFYFYRPMPVEQFDRLIADEGHIDRHGYAFKYNQQLHVRELLDERIYNDTMLNNILGPVAFYNWDGVNIDIIRYNQQFYQLVGIEPDELTRRSIHIQDFLLPEDREKMYDLLREAEQHHAVGAKDVIRVYQKNGMIVWLALQVYCIGSDNQGKKFYASARDVTELQFISRDTPGGYYRCTLSDGFAFLFISRNFLEMTGYTEAQIKILFDNRLINMVHPEDREGLIRESYAIMQGKMDEFQPYRIRRKQGDYIYVADQSRITNLYGDLCWQGIAIDVTDVMVVRNQMKILSDHLTDSVLFLHRRPQGLMYEVAIHGLSKAMGLDAAEFQKALNDGVFCQWIEGHRDIPHSEYTEQFAASIDGRSRALTVNIPGRETMRIIARADRVEDEKTFIEYIIVLHMA